MQQNSLLPLRLNFVRTGYWIIFLFLMSLGTISSALAQDIDCNSTFPGPIQSFDPKGYLYMQSDAQVLGYDGVNVCFPLITGVYEISDSACGAGKCVMNDNPNNRLSQVRTDVTLRRTSDNKSYTVAQWTVPKVVIGQTANYGRRVSAAQYDIGSLTVNGDNGGAVVSFSEQYTTYTLGSIRLDRDGVLQLSAGKTYIIDGDVTLASGSILVVGTGATKFYISGSYTSHNGSKFLSDGDIDIYVAGKFTQTSNSLAYGSVYVVGDAIFENSASLVGQIAARSLQLKSASTVVYRAGSNANTVPYCDEIFTQPPSGNHQPGLTPPSNIGQLLGDIQCDGVLGWDICNGINNFLPGDYNFRNGNYSNFILGQDSFVFTNGRTTRLYFDNLSLDGVTLNPNRAAENLIIYVRNSLSVTSNVNVNGIIYLAKGATLDYRSGLWSRPYLNLIGAIAAGGGLTLRNGSIRVLPEAVNNADFNGMCRKRSEPDIIDHFEIAYSAAPLVCSPEEITVRACLDAQCQQTYQANFSASISPSLVTNGSWQNGNQLNFSQGVATAYLKKNDAAAVSLNITDSSIATRSNAQCRVGSNITAAPCNISFAEAGFILNVPDKLAARSELVTIKAVKKDDVSQRCVSAFANTHKDLRFWSSVVERPKIDGYLAPPVTVNNQAVAEAAGAAKIQSVSFNKDGEALVHVNYTDAGKMALSVQYIGNSNGDDAGLLMDGSDNFVSFPAGLCVTATDSAAQCSSRDASCSAFTAAGAPFELNIRAKQWQSDNDNNICDNADTPSFAITNVNLSHKLLAPSAGQLGALALQNYPQQASITGTSVQQAISEVGVFTVAASVNQPYLGSTAFVIPAFDSAPIGRFYPASFAVNGVSVPPACGNFTYLAQPFNVSMTLKALNTSAALTQNYTGAFASGQPVFEAKAGATSADLSHRLPALPSVENMNPRWINGQLSYSNHSVAVARFATAQTEGPYSQFELGIRVDDSDSIPMFNATMRADVAAADCGGSCTAAHLETMDLRLGRAALANSYGPENQPVLMNGQSQFWNGNQWQLNSDDSCSVVTPAMQTQQSNDALGYSFEPSLTNGQQVIRTGAPAVLNNGNFGLTWLATGNYQGKVTAPVVVPDYLKWYWQFDGVSNLPQDPRASVYFGRYRGHDRIINWREVR